MSTQTQAERVSTGARWTGYVMTALPVLLLLMGAVMSFLQPPEVIEGMEHAGYPGRLAVPLGIVELVCAILYVIPRTSVLGAILMTGYFGGAVATHVRIGEVQFIIPIVVGILVWGGLFLRDPRIRALIPLRS